MVLFRYPAFHAGLFIGDPSGIGNTISTQGDFEKRTPNPEGIQHE
jgi:hypothetical protein